MEKKGKVETRRRERHQVSSGSVVVESMPSCLDMACHKRKRSSPSQWLSWKTKMTCDLDDGSVGRDRLLALASPFHQGRMVGSPRQIFCHLMSGPIVLGTSFVAQNNVCFNPFPLILFLYCTI